MAKKKSSKGKKVTQRVKIPKILRNWDQAAIDWARLLADPCGAKIVPPCYPTGGGILIRNRTVVNVGTGAGETAGFIHWVPSGGYYVANGTANPSAAFTASAYNSVAPFANISTRSPVVVAACIRAIPNASEMNRSGVLYCGNSSGNAVFGTQAGVTINGIASQLTYGIRAPDDSAELIWLPRPQDMVGSANASGGTTPDAVTGCSALTMAYTGAYATSGYTFELISVCEVPLEFGATTSLSAVNQYQPPPSRTDWLDVVKGTFEALGGTLRMGGQALMEVNRFARTITSFADSPGGRIAVGAARLALTM